MDIPPTLISLLLIWGGGLALNAAWSLWVFRTQAEHLLLWHLLFGRASWISALIGLLLDQGTWRDAQVLLNLHIAMWSAFLMFTHWPSRQGPLRREARAIGFYGSALALLVCATQIPVEEVRRACYGAMLGVYLGLVRTQDP